MSKDTNYTAQRKLIARLVRLIFSKLCISLLHYVRYSVLYKVIDYYKRFYVREIRFSDYVVAKYPITRHYRVQLGMFDALIIFPR